MSSRSCRLPMPTVNGGEVNVEFQLGLVRDGASQHFAGYLPGDNDASIAAVFKDTKPGTKVSQKGLNLTAIPHVPNGSVPEQCAGGQRVEVHLCKDQGECKAGKAGALRVAEWVWPAEDEEGEGSPLM